MSIFLCCIGLHKWRGIYRIVAYPRGMVTKECARCGKMK